MEDSAWRVGYVLYGCLWLIVKWVMEVISVFELENIGFEDILAGF